MPLNIKDQNSKQRKLSKLEAYREQKDGVVIPSKVGIPEVKKRVAKTHMKKD